MSNSGEVSIGRQEFEGVCEEDGSDVPRGMGIISEGIIHKLGRTCLPILQLGAQSVCIHMCQNICGFKEKRDDFEHVFCVM